VSPGHRNAAEGIPGASGLSGKLTGTALAGCANLAYKTGVQEIYLKTFGR
jgi:hypothetical protein